MAAHRDDPFGAELLRGEDAEQADRAVTDDHDGLARPRLRGHRGEPTVPGTSESARKSGTRSASVRSGVATRVPSAKGTRSRCACAPWWDVFSPRLRGSCPPDRPVSREFLSRGVPTEHPRHAQVHS